MSVEEGEALWQRRWWCRGVMSDENFSSREKGRGRCELSLSHDLEKSHHPRINKYFHVNKKASQLGNKYKFCFII